VIRNFGDNAPRRKRRRKRDLAEISSIESLSTTVRSSSAPIGLERQYDELHQLLRKGLVGEDSEPDIGISTTHVSLPEEPRRKRNVSALLLGGRGQGKSLVLDRCLDNLRQENGGTSKFRVVRINGVLLGRDVSVAVRSIVRQLSEIVAEETLQSQIKNATDGFETKTEIPGTIKTKKSVKNMMREKLRNVYMSIKKKESYEFRTRQTTFNSSLALLDEALQTACIDSIPILLVLDELDSFFTEPSTNQTGSSMSNSLEGNEQGGNRGGEAKSERHLLLYHILDRVNGSASLISLVGMTARLPVYGLFEKRVKSRAEGTSRIIHFGKPTTFESFVNTLLSNFDIDATVGEGNCANKDLNYSQTLKLAVKRILLPNDNVQGDEDRNNLLPEDLDAHETARDEKYKVSNIFALHWKKGSSVRWFCRVVSVALTLFTEDIRLARIADEEGKNSLLPNFDGTFLIEGLKAMSASIATIDGSSKSVASMSSQKPSNNCISSVRINELMDLSWSQLAVLLSAKRILARDAQVIQEGLTKVLTFERMQNEYKSYFLAQGKGSGADRFDDDVFFKSFLEMMYIYFRPAKDHTGVGPNEYHFSNKFSPVVMEHQLLKKTPLHWNIHESELIEALKEQRLSCSAALRDWAK